MTYTEGTDSDGILAQSVGGGGGAGGFNVTAGISLAGKGAGTVGVGVGGLGGNGGDLGVVMLDVQQRTDDSANTLYSAITLGDNARGIVRQSWAGGGARAASTLPVCCRRPAKARAISASELAAAAATAATPWESPRTSTATSTRPAMNWGALLLQSVGGGGGAGGFNVTGGIALSKKLAGNIMLGVGGFGGGGGYASDVDGTLTGDIITRGDGSFGAAMQSLGGGGGAGGFNVTGGISISMGDSGAGTLGVGIGGFGGDGGDAGSVTGDITGDITTVGSVRTAP